MHLKNVSRHCDDVYQCVAENDVTPSDRHSMKLTVQCKGALCFFLDISTALSYSFVFALVVQPEISLRTRVMQQALNRKTLLQCHVTAYPMARVFWEKSGRELQTEMGRYEVTVFEDRTNEFVLSLNIKNLRESDYGVYTCVASNSLGRATQMMTLKRT